MLSPRRTAQLCLAAATLTLVSAFTVLIAGASDTPATSAKAAPPSVNAQAPNVQVTPLATGMQTVATTK